MNDDNSAMNGDNMDSMGGRMNDGGANDGGAEEEVYDSLTEREVAFKMLAAHALVDRDFYFFLREDPVAAAASLHIALEESDYEYLRSGVQWDRIDPHADEIREAVNADMVVRSLW